MVTVSLLDRTRTRDRARPRPNAFGNFITANFFATVYSLTFEVTLAHYIKWWPYIFPSTKAIGYIDDPLIKPLWVAVGPVSATDLIPNLTDSLIPGIGPSVPPPDFIPGELPPIGGGPGLGVPIPIPPGPADPSPIDPSVTLPGATLVSLIGNKAGRTFTKTVAATVIQLSDTAFPIRQITILADINNAADVWLGYDPLVQVNNGFPLAPGSAKTLNIDDMSDVYILGQNATDLVHIEYTK